MRRKGTSLGLRDNGCKQKWVSRKWLTSWVTIYDPLRGFIAEILSENPLPPVCVLFLLFFFFLIYYVPSNFSHGLTLYSWYVSLVYKSFSSLCKNFSLQVCVKEGFFPLNTFQDFLLFLHVPLLGPARFQSQLSCPPLNFDVWHTSDRVLTLGTSFLPTSGRLFPSDPLNPRWDSFLKPEIGDHWPLWFLTTQNSFTETFTTLSVYSLYSSLSL